MLIVRVPAVVAAVLFMSCVSAKAMEFADRPGMTLDVISSLPAVRLILNDDYSRRQINNLNILLPTTLTQTRQVERPKPVSNIIPAKLSWSDRPGRLSAEFSAVNKKFGIKFGHRLWMASSSIKPTAKPPAISFEDPTLSRFRILAALKIRSEDRRGFTSSLAKINTAYNTHTPPSSVEFCEGSIAPCGRVNFAQGDRKGRMRAAVD
jgi:hypothetical protein